MPTFSYSDYFEKAIPLNILPGDCAKEVYRHLLFFEGNLPHIMEASEMRKPPWRARATRFMDLLALDFGVQSEGVANETGKLYGVREQWSGQPLQIQNVVGAGFEEILRVLIHRC